MTNKTTASLNIVNMLKTLLLLSFSVCFGQETDVIIDETQIDLQACFPFFYASKPRDIGNSIPRDFTRPTSNQLSRYYVIPHANFEVFFLTALDRKCRLTPYLRSNEVLVEKNATWDPLCDDLILEAHKKMEDNFIYKWVKAGGKNARQELLATEQCADSAIQTYFLWLPGNIFIGPKPYYRTDKTGGNFETGAVYLLNRADYEDLIYLDNAMAEYMKGTNFDGQPFSEDGKDALLDKITLALDRVQQRNPHRYNRNQWVAENDIFSRIKTDRDEKL